MADKPVIVVDGLAETIGARGFSTKSGQSSNWDLSTKTGEEKYAYGVYLCAKHPELHFDPEAANKDQTILWVIRGEGVGGNITCRRKAMVTFQGAHQQYWEPLKGVVISPEMREAVLANSPKKA